MRLFSFLDPKSYREPWRVDMRPLRITFQTAALLLAWWLVVDAVLVWGPEVHGFVMAAWDIVILVGLPGILVCHVWRLRKDRIIALLTLLLALLLGFLLFLAIGIPFHILIGGTMDL